jgi:hypothetical protein
LAQARALPDGAKLGLSRFLSWNTSGSARQRRISASMRQVTPAGRFFSACCASCVRKSALFGQARICLGAEQACGFFHVAARHGAPA